MWLHQGTRGSNSVHGGHGAGVPADTCHLAGKERPHETQAPSRERFCVGHCFDCSSGIVSFDRHNHRSVTIISPFNRSVE